MVGERTDLFLQNKVNCMFVVCMIKYGLVQNIGPYSVKKRQSYQADNTEIISPRYPFTPDSSGAVHRQSDWTQRRVQDKEFINPRQKLQRERYLENLVELSNLMTNSFGVSKTVLTTATQTQPSVAEGETQTAGATQTGETQTEPSLEDAGNQTEQAEMVDTGTEAEEKFYDAEDSGYDSLYSDSVVEAAALPPTKTSDRLFADKHTIEPETMTNQASTSYKKFAYRGIGITGDLPPRAPNYLGIKTTSLRDQALKLSEEEEENTPTESPVSTSELYYRFLNDETTP